MEPSASPHASNRNGFLMRDEAIKDRHPYASDLDIDAPALLFLSPDLNTPIGGIMKIYRQVEVLRRGGVNAYVLHSKPGFRCAWFESAAPTVSPYTRFVSTRDLLVLPEIFLIDSAPGSFGPDVPFAVFNQNAYYTFDGVASTDGGSIARTPNTAHSYLGTVCVSEDNRRYLELLPEVRPVFRVRYGVEVPVDSETTTQTEPRVVRQIAYMPRKNPDHSRQVLGILASRAALTGWIVKSLDGLTHRESIEQLQRSSIFLSFGYPEGFGLPILEAMAARCLVVGYHGEGGSEALNSATGLPVPFGDIRRFAETAEAACRLVEENGHEHIVRRALTHVRQKYSLLSEEASILDAWTNIAKRHPLAGEAHTVRGGVPGDDPPGASVRELEARIRRLERDMRIKEQEAKTQNTSLLNELDSLYESKSWRYTAFLRRLGNRRSS